MRWRVDDVDPIEGAAQGYRDVDAVGGSPDATGDGHVDDAERDRDPSPGDEPFGDEPFEVPQPPVTGDAMVDDATRRVALAARESLDVQVAVYDAVHRGLQDRLADVED